MEKVNFENVWAVSSKCNDSSIVELLTMIELELRLVSMFMIE